MVEATSERVRTAALALFAEQGYEKTSLREIADRVGITKASLYYHYPSKQALLESIVLPLIVEWKQVIQESIVLPHHPGSVRLALDRCLDTMLKHRAASGLFTRDGAAVLATIEPHWSDFMELMRRFYAWLAGPAASAETRLRAAAAVETLGVALSSAALMPDISEDDVRRVLPETAAAILGLPPAALPVPPDLPATRRLNAPAA